MWHRTLVGKAPVRVHNCVVLRHALIVNWGSDYSRTSTICIGGGYCLRWLLMRIKIRSSTVVFLIERQRVGLAHSRWTWVEGWCCSIRREWRVRARLFGCRRWLRYVTDTKLCELRNERGHLDGQNNTKANGKLSEARNKCSCCNSQSLQESRQMKRIPVRQILWPFW